MKVVRVIAGVVFIALLLSYGVGLALVKHFPSGCRQVGFTFERNKLILSSIPEQQTETLYLLHNITSHDILLKVPTVSRYIPNHKKTIPSDHWAMFSRKDNEIDFTCHSATTGDYDTYGFAYPCRDMVEVCNYNHAKFPPQNIGTYWLQFTSLNQRQVMRVAIKKGILLRWNGQKSVVPKLVEPKSDGVTDKGAVHF